MDKPTRIASGLAVGSLFTGFAVAAAIAGSPAVAALLVFWAGLFVTVAANPR